MVKTFFTAKVFNLSRVIHDSETKEIGKIKLIILLILLFNVSIF
jgi:hypothetical protein